MFVSKPMHADCTCDAERATEGWHSQGIQEHNQTKHSQNQPIRPSTGTNHRSRASTGLRRRSNPRVKSHHTHQHSKPARTLSAPCQHHTDPAGSSSKSSQPTQPSARRRWAEPHRYTDTTRTSGYTRYPPSGGAVTGAGCVTSARYCARVLCPLCS